MIKNVRMMSLLVLIVFTLFPILQVAHVASAENHPPADGHVHPPPPPPPRDGGDVAWDVARFIAGSVATGIGAATALAGVGLSSAVVTAPPGAAAVIGGTAIVGSVGPPTYSSGRNLWNDITGLFDGDDD